jgi:hypothetical protein
VNKVAQQALAASDGRSCAAQARLLMAHDQSDGMAGFVGVDANAPLDCSRCLQAHFTTQRASPGSW